MGFLNRSDGGTGDDSQKGDVPRKPLRIGFTWQIAFWLLIGVSLAISVTYLEWRILGSPQIAPTSQTGPNQLPVEASLSLLRISLTVVAGVGGIVALVVAYRKQRIGEAQHQREELAARREDQKLYAERFAKTAELLGSDSSAVRLAAVYALGNLADDWKTGRQTCIDVLCAYLRMPHKPFKEPPIDKIPEKVYRPFEEQTWRNSILAESPRNPSEELQVRSTIIRVIVEHLNPEADTPWFGHSFNLNGAVLESPKFQDAHFRDCYVDFGDSLLYGEVDFSGSTFTNSQLYFTSTILGGSCKFEYCEFVDSKIDLLVDVIKGASITFSHCAMKDSSVDVSGLELESGDFSFTDMEMTKSKLEIGRGEFQNSSLALSRAKLKNSKIAIRNASFTGSSLYLSGVRIGRGSRVLFTSHIHHKSNGPTITGTKISLNDVGIHNGGFLGFQRQTFIRTPLHWEFLEVKDAELALSECQTENSPISFDDSERDAKGRIVIDICSSDSNAINTTGLTQPSDSDGGLLTMVRPGLVDDVDDTAWTQPRTPQNSDVDPALRPHIKSWH